MPELTTDETKWVKAAAAAFLAIRNATQSKPDGDQIRDINFLADALHNIGMASTGNAMFGVLHTDANLQEVARVSNRLLHSIHRAHPKKASLFGRMFQAES